MAARRIYIIDDDDAVLGIMTAVLETAGHKVRSNLVGAHAIPEILEMRPQCVLIDLMMSDINGYEVAQELKKRRELAGTKFIMISARTDPMWSERSREHGFDGYITKPINPQTFAGEVEALIG